MGLLHRHKTNDLLYLTPVRLKDEQLTTDKIRVLYCDAEGNVGSIVIENSVYELAQGYIEGLERSHKNYAILGLKITPEETVPFAVEIKAEQVWALNNILNHALSRGKIPEVLKKYPREIIRLGEAKQKELRNQYEQAKQHASPEATPYVLDRLSYHPEDSEEAAIPILKAEYQYPLVVLKRLPPEKQTRPDIARLLILDSDGDMGIIRVPADVIDEVEKHFEEWKNSNNANGCIIYSQYKDGFRMSYTEISELQRKAVDIITQRYDETGRGERPISADVQEVLTKARLSFTDK